MLKKCWLGFTKNQYPVAHDITGINILRNQHLTQFLSASSSLTILIHFMCVTVTEDILLNLYTSIYNFCVPNTRKLSPPYYSVHCKYLTI